MHAQYRLTNEDLQEALTTWDKLLKRRVLVVACGGTALTLYGYKESTKDVDFLVPVPEHYDNILRVVKALGYTEATGNSYKHPDQPWLFELFRGQTIFQTELLEPVQEEGKHRVIKEYEWLVLSCLNPEDLIISKMFRGTMVDVQDSIVMIKSEQIDLVALADRYRETAGYYYNPGTCKKNLEYLITELE